MIRFDNVSKRYASGTEALNQVSFKIQAGEPAFLTGRSGAGKSTLLKLVPGMEKPGGGEVPVDGKKVSRLSATQLPFSRRGIGAVFQNHQLLFDRSVFDNVALPLQVCQRWNWHNLTWTGCKDWMPCAICWFASTLYLAARRFLYTGNLLGLAGGILAGLPGVLVGVSVGAPWKRRWAATKAGSNCNRIGTREVLLLAGTGFLPGWLGAWLSTMPQLRQLGEQ